MKTFKQGDKVRRWFNEENNYSSESLDQGGVKVNQVFTVNLVAVYQRALDIVDKQGDLAAANPYDINLFELPGTWFNGYYFSKINNQKIEDLLE